MAKISGIGQLQLESQMDELYRQITAQFSLSQQAQKAGAPAARQLQMQANINANIEKYNRLQDQLNKLKEKELTLGQQFGRSLQYGARQVDGFIRSLIPGGGSPAGVAHAALRAGQTGLMSQLEGSWQLVLLQLQRAMIPAIVSVSGALQHLARDLRHFRGPGDLPGLAERNPGLTMALGGYAGFRLGRLRGGAAGLAGAQALSGGQVTDTGHAGGYAESAALGALAGGPVGAVVAATARLAGEFNRLAEAEDRLTETRIHARDSASNLATRLYERQGPAERAFMERLGQRHVNRGTLNDEGIFDRYSRLRIDPARHAELLRARAADRAAGWDPRIHRNILGAGQGGVFPEGMRPGGGGGGLLAETVRQASLAARKAVQAAGGGGAGGGAGGAGAGGDGQLRFFNPPGFNASHQGYEQFGQALQEKILNISPGQAELMRQSYEVQQQILEAIRQGNQDGRRPELPPRRGP